MRVITEKIPVRVRKHIDSIEAENKRLRNALRPLLSTYLNQMSLYDLSNDSLVINARQALKETE